MQGQAWQKFHNETVKRIIAKRVQCDEISSFVYSKQKNVPNVMEGVAGGLVWMQIQN